MLKKGKLIVIIKQIPQKMMEMWFAIKILNSKNDSIGRLLILAIVHKGKSYCNLTSICHCPWITLKSEFIMGSDIC